MEGILNLQEPLLFFPFGSISTNKQTTPIDQYVRTVLCTFDAFMNLRICTQHSSIEKHSDKS